MDSKLIYAASDALKYKVKWIRVSADTEWIYFGNGAETNKSLAIEYIVDYFTDSQLCIALGRNDSSLISRHDLEKALDNLLGVNSFLIWDPEFKRVIEFNYIGVLRKGYMGV